MISSVVPSLKPAPSACLSVCACVHDKKKTHHHQVFTLFCSHDKAQRGCLTLESVYKMLGERKSIFGDSLFELIGERCGRQTSSTTTTVHRLHYESSWLKVRHDPFASHAADIHFPSFFPLAAPCPYLPRLLSPAPLFPASGLTDALPS